MPWRETPADLDRARAERPVVVPSAHGHLFGIYTPASPDAPPAGRCVVWFTLPRSHRNRMWVEGARRLATLGFSCFRFDYHGVGESEGESVEVNPNRPYREDALAVLRHLKEHFGEKRFVLFGSCFDARTALSAFDGEAAAIDALFFMAAPVMEDAEFVKADADRKDFRHLLRALGRPDNWRALKDPARWGYMGTVLGRVVGRKLQTNGAPPPSIPLSESFLRHFALLERSAARAMFFYGREDREYPSFQHAERALWPQLSAEARARMPIERWEGKVHDGTLEMVKQREIVEFVLSWMEAQHPRAAERGDRATA